MQPTNRKDVGHPSASKSIAIVRGEPAAITENHGANKSTTAAGAYHRTKREM